VSKPNLASKTQEAVRQKQRESMRSIAKDILEVMAPLVRQGVVAVIETDRGVSIEINDSLLFSPGQANLSASAIQAMRLVATVIADSEIECFRLDKVTFQRVIEKRPELMAQVATLLAKRRVELQAAREGLDADTARARQRSDEVDLLARMKRFFEGELAARGRNRAEYMGIYGAGPLDDQRFFMPKACENGEGVDASGTITWVGGKARYLYVMEKGTTSPGAPPNLDLPNGVIWRFDVPPTAKQGLESGTVKYGVVPEGTTQKFPATGSPAALVSGKEYYLSVMQDIGFPATRCVFTMK